MVNTNFAGLGPLPSWKSEGQLSRTSWGWRDPLWSDDNEQRNTLWFPLSSIARGMVSKWSFRVFKKRINHVMQQFRTTFSCFAFVLVDCDNQWKVSLAKWKASSGKWKWKAFSGKLHSIWDTRTKGKSWLFKMILNLEHRIRLENGNQNKWRQSNLGNCMVEQEMHQ